MSNKEAIKIHRKAFADVHRLCPKLFPSILLYSLVEAVSPYVTIYLSARLIDELASLRRPSVLWGWVAWTVGAGCALMLLRACLLRWKKVEEEVFAIKQEQLFAKKFFSMDFADIDKQSTYDLRSQVLQNQRWGSWGIGKLASLAQEVSTALLGILSAVFLSVSLFMLPVPEQSAGYRWLNNPLFVLLLVAVIGAISFLSGKLGEKVVGMWSGLAEISKYGNRIFNFWSGLGSDRSRAIDIRMYEQQKIAEHYWKETGMFTTKGEPAKLSRGKMGLTEGLSEGISAFLTGFIYLFTCLKAMGGAFGVGSITQYVGAVTALSKNIGDLFRTWGTVKSNAAFLKPVYQLLDIPNSMYQGSLTTEKRSDRKYEVEFRNVSFRYPGSEQWALHNVSLRFRVGERMAVVGENGSGKTTFIKLLCRLYDPQEGQILLNGIDIRKYRYDDYMHIFSVVFQDFQLISQPLGDNVAGSCRYDREKVETVLRKVGFGERLDRMPNGLDTVLYRDFSETGVELSGGEAQKVAIARALYKDSPFIILDEPTAALDPIAEAEIYARFNEIAQDKTTIYISHRLSSCRFCDEILVFDGGKIVQQGNHDSLIADVDGKYNRLWQAQAQYYEKEQEESASEEDAASHR